MTKEYNLDDGFIYEDGKKLNKLFTYKEGWKYYWEFGWKLGHFTIPKLEALAFKLKQRDIKRWNKIEELLPLVYEKAEPNNDKLHLGKNARVFHVIEDDGIVAFYIYPCAKDNRLSFTYDFISSNSNKKPNHLVLKKPNHLVLIEQGELFLKLNYSAIMLGKIQSLLLNEVLPDYLRKNIKEGKVESPIFGISRIYKLSINNRDYWYKLYFKNNTWIECDLLHFPTQDTVFLTL